MARILQTQTSHKVGGMPLALVRIGEITRRMILHAACQLQPREITRVRVCRTFTL